MSQSHTLTALTPREAVTDALHRCFLGLNTKDEELFASAFLKDEATSMIIGPTTHQGWDAINALCKGTFDIVTTHHATNIRVDLKTENTASLSAHVIAYHVRPDEAMRREDTKFTVGELYLIDLVRDHEGGGLWKFKRWEIKVLWTTGDPGVLPA